MNDQDHTYQFYFPNYFSAQNTFVKYLKHSNKYEDYCFGKVEAYYIDQENYGTRRVLPGISDDEKYRREYLWNEFTNWLKWNKSGRNIFSFSEDLLQMLSHTDVDDVELDSLKFPYDNFYLSLRHLKLPFIAQEENLIDGVYVNIEYNDNLDEESTFDFSIILDFVGDYEKYAIKYNDSVSEIFNFTFKRFNIALDKKQGIKNIHQALLDHKEFFRQEIVLKETNGDKVIDIFQFNQQLIERTIRVVINSLLYLSLPDRDLKQNYGDLPVHLSTKLSNAKTKRKKEVVEQDIKQAGFTKINFVGQNFKGIINQHKKAAGEVPTHWRRGHWRNQRYGEELIESRLIWIRPTIVNKAIGIAEKGHIYYN